MNILNHRLIQEKAGLTLIIYLNQHETEFSRELGDLEQSKTAKIEISRFIRERYPKVKIAAVKVMVGSMLIGSFMATEINAEEATYTEQNIVYSTYQVKSGDTLFKLSTTYQTSIDRIKELNHLTNDNLYVGQQIKLPVITYFVMAGDTLSGIAKKYGVSVEKIKSLNHLLTDQIYIGQKLLIPDSSIESTPEAGLVLEPQPAPTQTYTVMSGDTLTKIANNFGITVDQLKQTNNLSTDMIYVGQKLSVPQTSLEPVQMYETYTVQSGDSLFKIATNYNVTITVIKKANQLTSDTVFIGQVLKIPITPQKEIPQTEYKVVSGDSLSKIVQKFNITTESIKSANNLTTDMIFVGQILTIPTDNQIDPIPQPTETVYTVVSGDTLSIISKKFNTTVYAIKETNQLTSDMIFVGQKLMIPIIDSEVVKDTVPPETPTISVTETINRNNESTFLIEGNAEAHSTVRIKILKGEESVLTAETKANEQGFYQVIIDVSMIQDGSLTIKGTAIDQEGNQSNEVTRAVLKDTKPPTVSELQLDSFINAQNQFEFIVNGITDANASIVVIMKDGEREKVVDTISDEVGNFSVVFDASEFVDGPISLMVTATDQAGNQMDSIEKTIQKDTVIPDNPTIESAPFITIQNEKSFRIIGTAQPESIVLLRIEDQGGVQQQYEVEAGSEGQFEHVIDLVGYQEGTIFISAKVINRTGNKSATITKGVIKDTIAPSTITITSDDYISIDNQANYKVAGSAEKDATVSIELTDGVNRKFETIQTEDMAEFEKTFDLSDFNEGEVQIISQVTDQSGNKSPHATHTIIKDTTVPSQPKITVANQINKENQNAFHISGQSEAEAILILQMKDELDNAIIKEVQADQTGEFSANFDTSDLQDGQLFLTVEVKDVAGNI